MGASLKSGGSNKTDGSKGGGSYIQKKGAMSSNGSANKFQQMTRKMLSVEHQNDEFARDNEYDNYTANKRMYSSNVINDLSHTPQAQLPKNINRMARMQSVEDQIMPVNLLQRADFVKMQKIHQNYGGCVPETVNHEGDAQSNNKDGDETPQIQLFDNQQKTKTMNNRDLAKRLSKNPTFELTPDNEFFKNSQFGFVNQDDEGDTSGRMGPLLTQKKRPLSLKKIADAMSQGFGRSASHQTVQGSNSGNNSPRQAIRRSITSWILGQMKSKESESRTIQKVRDFDTPAQRVMSPNTEKRLRDQIYGFKRQKRDQEISIPLLAGFFPFLANTILQQKNSDIMLNIPETIIIHNEDLIRGSLNSGLGSFKSAEDSLGGSFFYLRNPQIIPSQGNLPSLPLVQRLQIDQHSRIHDAQHILHSWVFDLNIKKLKQHVEDRQDYSAYIPMAVTKRLSDKGGHKHNQQSLDFFEESAYYRLKVAYTKGKDVIVQRYIPARSNKNSIVRIVWQRGMDPKSHTNTNAGGYFKMFQISANKEYDGVIFEEKYSPKKKIRDPNKFLKEFNAVSPKAAQDEGYWQSLKDDTIPDKILNAQYMQELREKFSDTQGQNTNNHKEFQDRAQQLFKKDPDSETEKILLMQDEIDKVKEFQYQFCTSDKYPEKNFANELSPSSDLSYKSEIFFQAEQLIRILNAYIRKQRPDRRLSLSCFDFIQDYTDRRWKFLNLKYLYTEDIETGEVGDRDLYLIKNTLATRQKSTSPIRAVSPQHLKTEEQPNYMKKTKCEGDYCSIQLYDNDTEKKFQTTSSGNFRRSTQRQMLPFGYLRDAQKLIQFQQSILNLDFNLYPAKMGLDPDHAVPTNKRFKGLDGESWDFYLIMKKVIQLDRLRRKAIMDGKLRDIEYFQKFTEDLFSNGIRKSRQQEISGDPSIVSNGVQHALAKIQKLSQMFSELQSNQNIELCQFIQAEHSKMLQQTNSNKLFDNVPVCMNCMRIYQFLFELYGRIEDALIPQSQQENIHVDGPQTRFKNTMFLGLDPRLNDKVIAILKRQLDRMSKLQKAGKNGNYTRPSTPNSRQTSINHHLTESRFSSEELQNGIRFLKNFEASRNIQDASGKPPNPLSSLPNTFRTQALHERDTNSRPTSPYIQVQSQNHPRSSTNLAQSQNKFSRTSQVDLSIIRDRDMIPDIPGGGERGLGNLGSTRNASQMKGYNSQINQLPKGAGHVYLPPVSVNDYIINQIKQKAVNNRFNSNSNQSLSGTRVNGTETPTTQHTGAPLSAPSNLNTITRGSSSTGLALPPLVPGSQTRTRRDPAVMDRATPLPIEEIQEKPKKRKKSKKPHKKDESYKPTASNQLPEQRCTWLGEERAKRHLSSQKIPQIGANYQPLQAIPVRSRVQAASLSPHKQSHFDMQDGPNINVVTKWHIKNYQPTVYDEIQKILGERKKKLLKMVKRAKRKKGKKTQAEMEIEQLVNKYYSSAKLEEEFEGPIELIIDSTPHGDIQLIERTASALTRNRYEQQQQPGTLEGLEFEGQLNTMEGQQTLDLEGESPLKMPPVQKSSLQADEKVKVVEANFSHIPQNSRANTLSSKQTPGFAHPSGFTNGNNLSIVQAAQQSSDEEGSLDITPDKILPKGLKHEKNANQNQDSQKQPAVVGEQVSSFIRAMHSTQNPLAKGERSLEYSPDPSKIIGATHNQATTSGAFKQLSQEEALISGGTAAEFEQALANIMDQD